MSMKTKAITMSVICVIMVLAVLVGAILFNGNKQIFDTTFSFNHAYVSLPDGGIIYDEVASWKDFEDGDSIQIKFKNGKSILTHISNVVLISD